MSWIAARRAKKEARAQVLEQFIASWTAQGFVPVKVLRVYQHAQRGSKAVLPLPDGQQVDAWFWWYQVSAGTYVFVAPGVGYGSHTHKNDVRYIGSKAGQHGVAAVMTIRDVRFLEKHRRKTAVVR